MQEPHARDLLKLVLPTPTLTQVGMNGGHSLVAMLTANANLSAHVFDLFKWGYLKRAGSHNSRIQLLLACISSALVDPCICVWRRYSWPAASLINSTFAGRVTFHEGWSHK